jgi:DNA-binding HxlR family transcriptional regulator
MPQAPNDLWDDYVRVVHEVESFAVRLADTIRDRNAAENAEFLHRMVGRMGTLFQKWNVEIMSLLGLKNTLRFNELKAALHGISSRTLSLKLSHLEQEHLVERHVKQEKPLRVEYSLSADGRRLARLMVPLIVFLNAREDPKPLVEA